MKRISVIISLAALCTALMAGTAFAQGTAPDWADKAGAIGVGGNSTLGGTNGIHIRTYVTPLIGVDLNFGMDMTSVTIEPDAGDAGDTSTSDTTIDVGVYGSYKIAYWQRGSLSGILGFDFRSHSEETDAPGGDFDTDSSFTNFVIGLGLRGEYFPTQYLSLHADVGLTIDPITDDDAEAQGQDTENFNYSGMDIGFRSELWGAAGFTVWFQ